MAELYKAVGMTVVGLRRTASPGEAPPPNVDTLYATEQLHEALKDADFVVLATPATPQTEGMIGRPELAVMQPHASLMNIARGSVAVWDEVLEALREGQIGAYYTDVADTERMTLPKDHPDWSTPNLFVTPHQSYVASDYGPEDVAPTERFVGNLVKLLSGSGELDGVCDMSPGAGY